MEIKQGSIHIKTYEEFLNSYKVYDGNQKCFVAGCNNPAYYEGGDARFYCGMCEEHADMRNSYYRYLKLMEWKIRVRMKWNPSDSLEQLHKIVLEKLESWV